MNIHFISSDIHLQLNLFVVERPYTLLLSLQMLLVLANASKQVGGIDVIIANISLGMNNGFSVKCWQKEYTLNC